MAGSHGGSSGESEVAIRPVITATDRLTGHTYNGQNELRSVGPMLRGLPYPRLIYRLSGPLIEDLGEHGAPGGPVMVPLGAPGVDAVGDALGAESICEAPGFGDVLGASFAGGEEDEAFAEFVEVGAGESGDEVKGGGDPEVVGELMGLGVVEAADVVGAAHADGAGEDVRESAEYRDGVEGPDGSAGGPDFDVRGLAIHADGGDDLVADVAVELVLDPHLVLGAAFAFQEDAAADAVAGVDL